MHRYLQMMTVVVHFTFSSGLANSSPPSSPYVSTNECRVQKSLGVGAKVLRSEGSIIPHDMQVRK